MNSYQLIKNMPTTEEATLQLIQREISEAVQREKELRASYSRSESVDIPITTNGVSKPQLGRAQSTPVYTNGHSLSTSNGRLFAQNPTAKGVMHRFIKSRGRMTTIASMATKDQPSPTSAWKSQEFSELPIAQIPPGMQPRNGFIPVEERIRKEIQETQQRETELRIERQKSQPDLLALIEPSSPEPERSVRAARSVSHLNDYDSYEDTSSSEPTSLKAARSLADLCDVNEETQPPGSHILIKQWENIIQQNTRI